MPLPYGVPWEGVNAAHEKAGRPHKTDYRPEVRQTDPDA